LFGRLYYLIAADSQIKKYRLREDADCYASFVIWLPQIRRLKIQITGGHRLFGRLYYLIALDSQIKKYRLREAADLICESAAMLYCISIFLL